ncbi:hypothetical protein MBAV_006232 [Candidatus Magnetobacterium bavaricum]|uniref:Uncharacterized protein n=1 Tax=Candidatus Magnetobacterium bavaricum TaxID=29290 RepID=A0A0F3GHZ2_9BACT|nr:hypothetical protein MBAV_006232 [Candidatus Magnetobacterium bavaricum]
MCHHKLKGKSSMKYDVGMNILDAGDVMLRWLLGLGGEGIVLFCCKQEDGVI